MGNAPDPSRWTRTPFGAPRYQTEHHRSPPAESRMLTCRKQTDRRHASEQEQASPQRPGPSVHAPRIPSTQGTHPRSQVPVGGRYPGVTCGVKAGQGWAGTGATVMVGDTLRVQKVLGVLGVLGILKVPKGYRGLTCRVTVTGSGQRPGAGGNPAGPAPPLSGRAGHVDEGQARAEAGQGLHRGSRKG